MRSKIAAILGVGAVMSLQFVAAGPASAATSCKQDPNNPSHYYCQNRYGAPLWYVPYNDPIQRIVSRMLSTDSWFICRIDHGDYVGGPHPYRWVWTKGDTLEGSSTDSWGWMKDIDIASETNSLPTC